MSGDATQLASVTVVAPGALSMIQDLGRPGWRRLGVPRSGALDPALLRIANALVGNPPGAPAIEFFLAGPTLEAADAPVQLGVAGDVDLTLTAADGQRTQLPSWRSVTLRPGELLRIGQPRGARAAYVALAGARCEPVLGSASTYLRARLGGLRGAALAVGDRLTGVASQSSVERLLREPPVPDPSPIRVVPGPQADHFDEAALVQFFAGTYTVSADADRMGVRLQGAPLVHRADKGAEIVSDATVPGSIQVPGNGLPIVLLADGQTAGGYPKIGTVISADLPRLATAPVGSALRFARAGVEDGEAAALACEAALQDLVDSIRPLQMQGDIDLEAIYVGNLISGMIDAADPP